MTVGLTILALIVIGTLLGLLHRVYDRMRLTDSQALLFLILLIIGSFINIPILKGVRDISLNVGGGILPVVLAFYVLGKADASRERIRAMGAALISAAVLYGITKLMANFGHGRDIIDPLYIYGVTGGVISYIISRSRRSAFISGTLSVLFMDIIHLVELMIAGAPGEVMIGGAGAFDAIIVAGLVSTLLAEIIGESRERLAGGPAGGNELPSGMERKEGGEK